MSGEIVTRVTLRALEGEPLADERVRSMVVATARAIAERTGVRLEGIETTPTSVTASLEAGRVAAIGFAAELRRLTTRWHQDKFGSESLWGEAPHILSDEDLDDFDDEFNALDEDDDDEDWDEEDEEDSGDEPPYDVGEPWR